MQDGNQPLNDTENYPLDEASIAIFAEGVKQIDLVNAQMGGALRLFLRQHKLPGNWRIAQNGRELERVVDAPANAFRQEMS